MMRAVVKDELWPDSSGATCIHAMIMVVLLNRNTTKSREVIITGVTIVTTDDFLLMMECNLQFRNFFFFSLLFNYVSTCMNSIDTIYIKFVCWIGCVFLFSKVVDDDILDVVVVSRSSVTYFE
jgi:hypothetical protein